LSGAFLEAEGSALRRPDLRAGKTVDIQGLGTRFSGNYLISRSIHSITPEGITTKINVAGSRLGLLAEHLYPYHKPKQWPGVVTAVVTNSDDPRNWGRIGIRILLRSGRGR
jgi:hypothetical protein